MIPGLSCISKVSPDTNVSLGVEVLKSQGFFPEAYWYWIGVGALIGMTVVFNSCYIMALTYLNREYYQLSCFCTILFNTPLSNWCHALAALGKPQIVILEDENEVSTDKNGKIRLSEENEAFQVLYLTKYLKLVQREKIKERREKWFYPLNPTP